MITGLFKLLVSVAAVVLGTFVFEISAWFIPLEFIVGFLAANVLIWIFFLVIAATASRNPKGEKLSLFYGAVLNAAIIEVCWLARIKVKATGLENIPNQPYLLIANHRSNFDNFIISSVVRNPYMVFISKPSNFKIPFAGRLVARCRYLAIDRENPRAALKTIHKASDMVKAVNASVCVFPEGTRGHEDGVVAPFSEGCFLIAKKAACPIVVACIKGSNKISKRFPLTTDVKLDFLKLITAEEVAQKRSGELSEIAHSVISANL